jgi:hypothetical protein
MTGWAVVDVFQVRDRLSDDYREFTGSFVCIRDKRIEQHVDENMAYGYQWPDLSFASGGTTCDIITTAEAGELLDALKYFRVAPSTAAQIQLGVSTRCSGSLSGPVVHL